MPLARRKRQGLCKELRAAKQQGAASLPVYSRERSDPVPDGVVLERTHRCVLVEGNYLLMRADPRWQPLDELWDERWFVACADREEQRRRLIARRAARSHRLIARVSGARLPRAQMGPDRKLSKGRQAIMARSVTRRHDGRDDDEASSRHLPQSGRG